MPGAFESPGSVLGSRLVCAGCDVRVRQYKTSQRLSSIIEVETSQQLCRPCGYAYEHASTTSRFCQGQAQETGDTTVSGSLRGAEFGEHGICDSCSALSEPVLLGRLDPRRKALHSGQWQLCRDCRELSRISRCAVPRPIFQTKSVTRLSI